MTTGSTHRDPRNIITPDAFEVAEELLGTPLALPRKRLFALLIDLVVVGFVTLVTSSFAMVLGVVAAIFFIRAGFKRTPVKGSVFGRAMRFSVGCLGLFIGLVTASVWAIFGFDVGSGGNRGDDEFSGPAALFSDASSMPFAGVIVGLATQAMFASVDDLEEAEEAVSEFIEVAEELGIERDEMLGLVLAAIPDDASWAGEAGAAFTRLIDRNEGERSASGDELVADDQARAERQLASIREQLERERGRGIFGVLRNFVGELSFGFGWWTLYLTVFLSWWNGQTVGKRLMGIRVVRLDGEAITWWVAFERVGGYAAGFATGLLGFAQVFWDANRQGIHDRIVGTVVIVDGAQKVADWESAL